MTNNHPNRQQQQRPQPPPPYYNHPMFPQQRKHGYPPDSSHLFYYYHPYSYGITPDYPSQDNARKRQRRQTAGAFMQNLFTGGGGNNNNTSPGKKKNSTAQPRPTLTVPPMGIGPVRELNDNDVLSGRGGRINAHKGNVQFRELVMTRKKDYLAKTTKKLEKAHIAAEIVRQIRDMNPPGRFLKEEKDGAWWDIGDAKAIKKVGQALREDAPDMRKPNDNETDDKNSSNGSPKANTKKTSSSEAGLSTPKSSNNKAAPPGDASMSGEQKAVPNGVTVSGRGAKKIVSKTSSGASKASSSSDKMYQPLAFQEIAPPPSYQPVLPPTPTAAQHQFHGAGGRGGGISGAAAAAMTQEQDHFQVPPAPGDVAFGMPFHPPPVRIDANRETSMVSGLSGPSALSGLSGISGLSDPLSSLTAKSATGGAGNSGYNPVNSERQLQQLRQQWANKKQTALDTSTASSAMTGTRQLLASTNLGSSLGRSNSLTDLSAGLDNVSMAGGSMADHSLMGGGIGASGSIYSSMSFATMQSVIPIRDMRDPSEIASDVSGGGASAAMLSLARSTSGGRRGSSNSYWGAQHPYHPANNPPSAFYPTQQSAAAGAGGNSYLAQYQVQQQVPQQQQQHPAQQSLAHGEVASVANMSINSASDSLPSVSNSIMSDLSENLIALDLAENKLLDQL